MTQQTDSTVSRKRRSLIRTGDYVAVALAFAENAVEDRKRKKHCELVRLAARRFVKDLKHAQTAKHPRFNWDPDKANEACEFIEQLPHVEGQWDSPTLKLHPAHVFLVVNIFGFRKEDGSRRFDTALLSTARKNAKTTIGAAIMLAIYCLEEEVGPQLLSAATTGQQARIIWGIARRMVDRSPDLAQAFDLATFANSIVRYDVGGSFKPINSKASTQDGLNPSAVVMDEIHAQKDADLYNVLRSAMGARRNPFSLYTTTEGYETPGPWPELRTFAENILRDVIDADNFFALIFTLDDEDNDFDEAKWIKANPLLGIVISVESMRKSAQEAMHQPSSLSEFRIKKLNRRASTGSGWIKLPLWLKCDRSPIDLVKMERLPCYAALDLASTSDISSWRLVWFEDEIVYTWGRYWVPEDAVVQRRERGTVKYDGWINAGWIQQTPGNIADYNVIERDIRADYDRFKPKAIAYDPWNALQMVNTLQDAKLPMIAFRQGPASYHPAMQELERVYTSLRLRYGPDPVLTWMASNLVARLDVNGNMAPHKTKSAGKIDGMCTLAMALGVGMTSADRREFKIFVVGK